MATLLIDDDAVTVELSTLEKVEAAHGNLRVPRSAISGYWTAPNGLDEIPGFKLIGSGIPGGLHAGTWVGEGKRTFAVCHGPTPAVVLDLTGDGYDRVVVTVDDPDSVIAGLR